MLTRIRDLLTSRHAVHRIPPREQFRAIIERERCRADRSGAPLSLVALDVRDDTIRPMVVADIELVLQQRLRATDDFGFLDGDRLGIVLPDTDTSGAWKVAQDICELAGDSGSQVECEVYEYPAPTFPEGRTPGSSGAVGDRETAGAARSMIELLCQPLPWWKRGMDLAGAILVTALLSPVIALLAVAVKVTSPGPVLFCQRRTGLGGRPFTLVKFRSMFTGSDRDQARLREFSEQDGPAFKLQRDPRVTPLGKFLRTTSLDELPQLWNVIRGDMSMVGPRPLPCDESAECEPWQLWRLNVTPGITCIWQATARSSVPFVEWMRMDRRYLRRRSFWSDVLLLVVTIPAVLLRKGAS